MIINVLTGEGKEKSIDHQLDRHKLFRKSDGQFGDGFLAPYEKLDQRKKIVKAVEERLPFFWMQKRNVNNTSRTFATIWHLEKGVKHFTPQNTILAY